MKEAGTAPAVGTNNLGDRHVLPLSRLQGASVLTSGLAAGIAPVEVYTGPARNNVEPGATTAAASKRERLAVTAKPRAAKRLSRFRR